MAGHPPSAPAPAHRRGDAAPRLRPGHDQGALSQVRRGASRLRLLLRAQVQLAPRGARDADLRRVAVRGRLARRARAARSPSASTRPTCSTRIRSSPRRTSPRRTRRASGAIAFDSEAELYKLARHAPGCAVYASRPGRRLDERLPALPQVRGRAAASAGTAAPRPQARPAALRHHVPRRLAVHGHRAPGCRRSRPSAACSRDLRRRTGSCSSC